MQADEYEYARAASPWPKQHPYLDPVKLAPLRSKPKLQYTHEVSPAAPPLLLHPAARSRVVAHKLKRRSISRTCPCRRRQRSPTSVHCALTGPSATRAKAGSVGESSSLCWWFSR